MQEETFYEKIMRLSDCQYGSEKDFAYAVRMALFCEKEHLLNRRLSEALERAQNRLAIAVQLKSNEMSNAIKEIDSVFNALTIVKEIMGRIEAMRPKMPAKSLQEMISEA